MKKRFLLLVIPILLIIVGVVLLFTEDNIDYSFTPTHKNIKSSDISAEESYKQEVINKMLVYLNSNKISLNNDLTIDVNKIAKSDTCTGNVKFNKQGNYYASNFDINCINDDSKSSTEYSSYVFDDPTSELSSVKKISDGYIAISDINIVSHDEYSENDTSITKYDNDFNKLWTFNHLIESANLTYMGVTAEDNKAEYYKSYVEDVEEKDDKLFILISVYSPVEEAGDTRLLILNNDGKLYKEIVFSSNVERLIKIEGQNVVLYGFDSVYEYNYETDKFTSSEMNVNKDNNYDFIGEIDGNYIIYSSVSYYIENGINRVSGSYNLYLLDNKLNEKKSLDMSKVLGSSKNLISYGDIKIIDNKLYMEYEVSKVIDDYEELDYSGILILDKNLNVISNIKYTEDVINKIDDDSALVTIIGYYISDNELYVLLDFNLSDYIVVDKYDVNGKSLKGSINKKVEYIDEDYSGYLYTEPELLYGTDSKVVYYSIIYDDSGEGNSADKAILKLAEVNI